jgi:hypothetical protein
LSGAKNPRIRILFLLLPVPAVILNAVKDPEETTQQPPSDLSTQTVSAVAFAFAFAFRCHPSPKAEDLPLQFAVAACPTAKNLASARAHSHLLLPVPAVILNAVKDLQRNHPRTTPRIVQPKPSSLCLCPPGFQPQAVSSSPLTLDTPATIKSGETKARHKPGFRL